MANLTIAIDEDLLRRARIRALEHGTSVNAVLRSYLESYAGNDRTRRLAGRRLRELSERSRGGSGTGGRTWTREELHER
ncbi:MAG: CopG family transcriptional regulator [Jatrophihabitantaceae bacterium]